MKKSLLLLSLMAVYFSPVFCQTLYTNAVETGNRFNPGFGVSGTPIVVFDDVLIPSSLVQGTDSIRITKVKFGIRRVAAAPAVTVKFYYTLIDDTSTAIDNAIRIPPVLLGSVNFTANGATPLTAIVSLGDSVNALLKIKTDTGNAFAGYQTVFFGLSFSDSSSLNGWRITTPGASQSNNIDAMWIYDVNDPDIRFASFFNSNPPATFYLQVFGSGAKALPVTLAQFTAQRSGNINLLNWSTQQELNTGYFVIERSSDGRNFVSIGRVAAAGNSNTVRNYTFTDEHPAKGNNYYRLRTIDKDDLSKMSNIRLVRNEGMADVGIYPNPVTDLLNVVVNADNASEGFMVITDVSGKNIYSRPVKLPRGTTVLPVAVNNIAAGTYIMKIHLNDDVIVKKFSKQ